MYVPLITIMSKLVHPDNKFIDLVITGVMYIALCFIIPIFFLVKFLSSIIKRSLFLYMQEENMQGKVVLITGASSGIGEHLAYEYAKRKSSLVIVARREGRLNDVAEAARRLGAPDVLLLCADVSNPDACKKFVDQTIQHFGRLDHLVNNAGILEHSLFEDLTDVKFQPMMDINFWGSVYPTHYALPHLKKSKGKIVVNSSSAALMNPPESTFYSSSKAAVMSFNEVLRTELAPIVSITIITLGFVESEMTKNKQTHGEVGVNEEKHEPTKGLPVQKWFPLMNTEPCAKAVVEGVCRGKRYVTAPHYFRACHLIKYFCPEQVEWWYIKFAFAKPKQY